MIGYFDRHKVSEYERKVLNAIEKVATGTQCCDTILYKQGLTELSDQLDEPVPEDSFLLGLFLNYIRDSYGENRESNGEFDTWKIANHVVKNIVSFDTTMNQVLAILRMMTPISKQQERLPGQQ